MEVKELGEQSLVKLKKARFWSIFLLVITGLGSLSKLMGIPGILKPEAGITSEMTAEVKAMLLEIQKTAETTSYKALSLVLVALTVLSFVLILLAFLQLNKGQTPSKLGFILYLALRLFQVAQSVIMPTPTIEGINIGSFVIAFVIIYNGVLAIPAIFALVRLFQAEPKE
ncbi:hypothetical protein ACWOEH_02020 [Enterococcus nangangensis]